MLQHQLVPNLNIIIYTLLFGLLTKIVQTLILDNLKTEELKIILDCLDFFFNGLNLHFVTLNYLEILLIHLQLQIMKRWILLLELIADALSRFGSFSSGFPFGISWTLFTSCFSSASITVSTSSVSDSDDSWGGGGGGASSGGSSSDSENKCRYVKMYERFYPNSLYD